MNWELVVEHKSGAMENSTFRLKIPEGWLYRYGSMVVFVPAISVASSYIKDVNPYTSNTYGASGAQNQ